MKALIIAAGRGSRISDIAKDEPKPLIHLLGLSLIERIILTAKQAGITEFVIVIGYLGEKIKMRLGDGNKHGVKIKYVENEEWRKGNGVSVLKARELLNETFILLMSDHIFDPRILIKLKEMKVGDDECLLAVDKNPKEYVDLEDATLVKIENDRIVDTGKKIKEYNGIDCGIFLCSQSIFKALEDSILEGDETLLGGVKVLAQNGKMRYFDINGNFWIDIDTRDNYREAEKILCEKLIKATDGPVSKFLNRPISIRISKFLSKTSVTPNWLSFLSFIGCVLSALFFSLGNYFYILIGGFLSQFSSIIDGCDGEIARLKFQESGYGAWFDAVLDRYADALIIFGMVYGYWGLHADPKIWAIGFIALIGSFMNSYTATKYDTLFIGNERIPKIRLGRDMRLFLIMIGALFNQIFYTLLILGILTNAESIRRVYILRSK